MGKPLRESDPRRFLPLPAGVSVHEIADRCRRGVVEFVTGTAGGWSPVDLDLCYRSASGSFARPSRSQGALALAAVEGLFETSLMEAADVVRQLLASCATPRLHAFVKHAVERGFVVGAQDENGALGHVPVDVAGMTLVDRVASLLAADFLTRPNDYRSVSICEDCGGVSFEWTACDHEPCADSRESGVVCRDDGASVSHAAIFPPPES
jgi:hypothetical protein